MSVNIYGWNPLSTIGESFQSTLWGWKPIVILSKRVKEKYNLSIDIDRWELEDHCSFSSDDCNTLANGLEKLIQEEFGKLSRDEDTVPICFGSWVKVKTKEYYYEEKDSLNEIFPKGTILTSPVVTNKGEIVTSPRTIMVSNLNRWIEFLRNCGGFQIF